MAAQKYEGVKYVDGKYCNTEDYLTVEEALQISINGDPFTVTMRTPGNDEELVRGLIFTEDLYKSDDNDYSLRITKRNTQKIATAIDIKINPALIRKQFINSRNLLSVSSCGICGKRELDDIHSNGTRLKNSGKLKPELLFKMFRKMNSGQKTFIQSGGSHAAAAFSSEGKLLSIMEDIGRHNAVDKVIGDLLIQKKIKDASYLLVSGRISYEILYKAFVARIPFLAAVSAPSTLAVDYAKELGITLMGFCRENKITIYSNVSKLPETKKKVKPK